MSASFQLNISIDSTGLNNIYNSGTSVTIVKSIPSNGGSSPPVAWVTFQPFQTNSVIWTPDYYIYATTTTITNGATIIMTSQTNQPVIFSTLYTMQNGQFSSGSGGDSNGFTAKNSQGTQLNFGLAQAATVNGTVVTSPLNAVALANNLSVEFTPSETVSIFLSSTSNNGVVLSQVTGEALSVTLSTASSVANIGFNDSNNTFFLDSQTSTLDTRPLFRRQKAIAGN